MWPNGNFFIMSIEFDKNISDWSLNCTDHKNGNDFFMSLVRWPKIAVKKSQFFLETLGTKVVQFLCYTKLLKTKNKLLNWYYPTKFFFRKIPMIFDIENDFENQILAHLTSIFGHLTSLMKKSMPFLWSVLLWLQSEMFLLNSADMI